MSYRHSKVMPNNIHWAGIVFTFLLATVSFLTLSGGWVLYIFPLLIYFFGRGKQEQKAEGLAMTQ